MKPLLFIDMDQVLVAFCDSPLFKGSDNIQFNPPRMYEEYFFETLPAIVRW